MEIYIRWTPLNGHSFEHWQSYIRPEKSWIKESNIQISEWEHDDGEGDLFPELKILWTFRSKGLQIFWFPFSTWEYQMANFPWMVREKKRRKENHQDPDAETPPQNQKRENQRKGWMKWDKDSDPERRRVPGSVLGMRFPGKKKKWRKGERGREKSGQVWRGSLWLRLYWMQLEIIGCMVEMWWAATSICGSYYNIVWEKLSKVYINS